MTKLQFTSPDGDFTVKDPELLSYLYFPLANENGVMSVVSPDLGGDSKTGQNTFLMPPVSCDNLHNDKSSRNFWLRLEDGTLWSATGRSAAQQAKLFTDKEDTELSAGFMHHTLTRTSEQLGLTAEIKNFVPSSGEMFELMKVTITNTGDKARTLEPVAAIPIYGRSATNIRDHRHVTALLHRITTDANGIVVNPTMTFDERGHKMNTVTYGVFGGNDGVRPVGYFPVMEEFIGEGGNLENPRALYEKDIPCHAPGYAISGYEALGGLVFAKTTVAPGESFSVIVAMGYGTGVSEISDEASRLLSEKVFDAKWDQTVAYWKEKVNVTYHTGDPDFDAWMKWISFQPMLRRIYGCSFLPHHDYGKGGRGWRDLWQDCLALLIMNPDGVRQMLVDNFGGVRMDGTNATIIGSGQGEFIADRNGIARVWMDHGVWPFLTTDLYIEQTGDVEILLEENTYFKDLLIKRGEGRDTVWSPEEGEKQRTASGEIYKGSLIEHLLIQNLSSFYDVGEHGEIRLRGADWNDALDMAADRGESVAFTTMYAYNLNHIADLLDVLAKKGHPTLSVAEELGALIFTEPAIYDDKDAKRNLLFKYCDTCGHTVSGRKIDVDATELAKNLRGKASWMMEYIRKNEWVTTKDGHGFFNGYYDNSGRRVEGETEDGNIRIMLTSQVFTTMSGTATDAQVKDIIRSADDFLYDGSVGGYKLNSDFHEVKMDLGRMFGFAYGHKENGAVFCHMATMFGNALYRRSEYEAAYKVFESLYKHASNVEVSKIYPGIPEYVDAKGRGVYHYLTGAASWLLVTVITEMFGIRGQMGDLLVAPRLLSKQFDSNGTAGLAFTFAGRKLSVIMVNKDGLAPGAYSVKEITIDGASYAADGGVIKRADIEALDAERLHEVRVILG